MTNNRPILLIATLLAVLATPSALAERLPLPIGIMDLGDGYHLEVSTEKAADWAASRFTLRKDGQNKPIDTRMGPIYALDLQKSKLIQIDLNSDGKKGMDIFRLCYLQSGF